ncbi:NAD(P)-binding domain-containing protein [Isoptericola croceus]|uniref:NAD(P)-binding domain-containing protein n=1 Tax=Isoptericola croceus TaxID=3031406 RepID=UPI0023F82EB9|nr:NAD(P)-binding domain-containing protein [Isoptericola croceus]
MRRIDTLVIGAGQAGLATSRCLTEAGREHVVLDRARPAESWRSARWDSLRLLTPNWMSRLPGWSYQGSDPDGYMSGPELVNYLEAYATSFDAPVQPWTAVLDVRSADVGYQVTTSTGSWRARHVVVAAGPRPRVPALAADLAPGLWQLHTNRYRNPRHLPPGGVLVVGASASGVQIANELRGAGRDVVLAVGQHTRLPRRYRGMDILWWLERIGALDRTVDDVADVRRARREPSLQLADERALDLDHLARRGVVLTGRLTAADGYQVHLADDLPSTVAAAEARLRRTMDAIDEHVGAAGLAGEVLAPDDIRPVRVPRGPTQLDLRAAGISTVVWATGFDYRYPWLRVPVHDADGEIAQYRGVTRAPGLYTIGLRFMHRRNAQFVDGVRHDARAIVQHLTGTADLAAPGPRHEGVSR